MRGSGARQLNPIEPAGRKAVEGRRSPGRKAFAGGVRMREASWNAPVLWRFLNGDKDSISHVVVSSRRLEKCGRRPNVTPAQDGGRI